MREIRQVWCLHPHTEFPIAVPYYISLYYIFIPNAICVPLSHLWQDVRGDHRVGVSNGIITFGNGSEQKKNRKGAIRLHKHEKQPL